MQTDGISLALPHVARCIGNVTTSVSYHGDGNAHSLNLSKGGKCHVQTSMNPPLNESLHAETNTMRDLSMWALRMMQENSVCL